jgi:hypothetical protein
MSFLQLYSREDSSKSNQFFREKYLCLLPIFIENASRLVYTFLFSINIYLQQLLGFFVFSGAIINQSPWSKFSKFQKVAESTSDMESHIFSKIRDLYLTFSKLVFNWTYPILKDASLRVL